MIKIDVTTNKHGDDLTTKNTGKIAGERAIVIQEIAYVLREFYSLDGGEILSIALGLMLEELTDDKRES